MIKEKLKKILFYALIIFLGLSATIAFYFFLSNQTSSEPWMDKIFLILRPFIIGGVIAYILKSTCNLFERLFNKALLKSGKRTKESAAKISSVISLVLTYVVWIAAVSVLIALVAGQFVESLVNLVNSLVENVPKYLDQAVEFVNEKLAGEQYADVRRIFNNTVNGLMNKLSGITTSGDLSSSVGSLATKLIEGITDIAVLIKDIAIGLVISVLLLAGRKRLAEKSKIFIKGIFKENLAKAIIGEFRFADRMFSGFLEGKVIDSTLIGFIYYIVLTIMGIEYAPLVAVVCGVTNIIPIFGPFLGAIPSAIIIFTESPVKVIWFIIFVFIIQFVDGYIIDPHIVGGNIKISSLSVLLAVTLFGGLWGFAGLLVGVPVFAVLYDIAKRVVFYVLRRRGKGHLIDEFNEKHKKKKESQNKKSFFGKLFGKNESKDGHPSEESEKDASTEGSTGSEENTESASAEPSQSKDGQSDDASTSEDADNGSLNNNN